MSFNRVISLLLLALAVLFTGCRSNQQAEKVYAVVDGGIYCLNNPGDGILTMKAWGTGANRAEAVDNAIRNAVREVLFKTIKAGPGVAGNAINPLVSEVNAQERYAYYFEPFFSQNGLYLRFATEDTNNRHSRTETKSASRQGNAIIVKVNRSALRQQLITDGILKP